jgi:hypothetical protein
MRLTAVYFENYRAFVDEARVELRPLTLLFGYNSAGKSSILRLLPILAASSEAAQTEPIALDSIAARGSSFKDLLSRQSSSPTLKIGLAWASETTPALEICYFIRDLADRESQVVEKLQISSSSSPAEPITALWTARSDDPSASTRDYEFRIGDATMGTFPMSVGGLCFLAPPGQLFSETANRAVQLVRELDKRVHWLNSLRAIPSRAARFGVRPRQMSADGANAGAYLAYDSLGAGDLLREASNWFERITGHRLAVLRYYAGGEQNYSVVVNPPNASSAVEVPVVDTGEGMAQVLPVVVLGCLARLGYLKSNSILAIEHPELHLHPMAHAELAALFCTVATASPNTTVVIETHSENLLLRVQIAIARGEISKEDVIIHWLRALDDGRSVIDTITFDDSARPQGSGWPPGVFREDTEQARTLIDLRRRRELE